MAAITSGIFAGAMLSSVLATGASVAGAAAGVAATAINAAKKSKIKNNAPAYNLDAEKKKAANQEAAANRARVLSETDTIKTSALGNTGDTTTKKKTILGG